ncbi:uncharacterized protein C8Q71DRAFT_863864 [Rhodofomes roseus]|uniref:Uncharacterized protein n=1 Tax=Rhodofomes roseus TaxID=34475 RepID=A0ABQ8JX25_9APHY|nr:uncharacterized protein C8Q71DRAFT_863864 [Rhodofomes roseus]KAH9828620.1 hypothetical protein C8Q71DRAFT_863864 [Rhodofomes roseus]
MAPHPRNPASQRSKRRGKCDGEPPPTSAHPHCAAALVPSYHHPALNHPPHEPVVKRRAQNVAHGTRNRVPSSLLGRASQPHRYGQGLDERGLDERGLDERGLDERGLDAHELDEPQPMPTRPTRASTRSSSPPYGRIRRELRLG